MRAASAVLEFVPGQGRLFVALVILWLLGRIACLVSTFLLLWLAAAVDLAFPFALSALAAREIIAVRNWRNVLIPIPIAVLGLADPLMYLEVAGVAVPAGVGWAFLPASRSVAAVLIAAAFIFWRLSR